MIDREQIRREANLTYLRGFCEPEPAAWTRPDELPRWCAVEYSGSDSHWIAFFETEDEAIGYFFSGEGCWMPAYLYDLDTGTAYHVDVTCRRGQETML